MKRTYLAKRNAFFSRENITPGSLAMAFALIALFTRVVLPDAFFAIITPATRVSSNISNYAHFVLSSFDNAALLEKQNENLTNRNISLTNENQALAQKLSDISPLLDGSTSKEGIIAGVITRPPESAYDTLLVNVGEASGSSVGMEAFGARGVPIGLVTATSAKSSRVTLFSAPNISINAWVGKNKLPILLRGAGGGAFNAVVPRTAMVTAGDLVYIPGPGALPIGSVARVDSDSSSPSSNLRIQGGTNIFSITWIELRDAGKVVEDALASASSTQL